jgi:hypothetical protein
MSDWKVNIREGWNECVTEFLIFRRDEKGIEMMVIDNPKIIKKRIGEFEPIIEPSFKLPYELSRTILPSLIEALDKKGIKSPSKSFTEGELTATKIHLDDMRKLVFK